MALDISAIMPEKKPTSNSNDMYAVANDYAQSPLTSYFYEDSYRDGIYTSAVSAISSMGGLNKRILNVDSTAVSSIYDIDYATAVAKEFDI